MKTKCKLTAILIALVVFTSCLFVGCDFKKEDEKDKKYDVAIKVKCSDGKEWIFQPGTDEIHYEYDYDGIERTFWVSKYNLVNHPQWGDKWFDPDYNQHRVFHTEVVYCPVGGKNMSSDGKVKERGVYTFSIITDTTASIWNIRYVYFYITVK